MILLDQRDHDDVLSIPGYNFQSVDTLPPPSQIDTRFVDSDLATPLYTGNNTSLPALLPSTLPSWIDITHVRSLLKEVAGEDTDHPNYRIFTTVFYTGMIRYDQNGTEEDRKIQSRQMTAYVNSRGLQPTPEYIESFTTLELQLIMEIRDLFKSTTSLVKNSIVSVTDSRGNEELIMKWLKYPEIFETYLTTRMPPDPRDMFPGIDIMMRLYQCDEIIRSQKAARDTRSLLQRIFTTK